jgi:inner membrane protein
MSNARSDFFKRLGNSAFARVLLLGCLILLLQMPIRMIGSLGAERAQTRAAAADEIAAVWGRRQDVMGPFLVVPYRPRNAQSAWQFDKESGRAVFLPEQLQIQATVEVEQRSRGIFDVPVYTAHLHLRGRLPKADPAAAGLDSADLQFDQAQLMLRLSDVHAVDALPKLMWNGAEYAFDPGTAGFDNAVGLRVKLPQTAAAQDSEFSISLKLRGTGGLYFAPMGRETSVTLKSTWPHPSFQGSWLPKQREIGDQGFTTSWAIPYVARGFASAWIEGAVSEQDLQQSRFGVNFSNPVDLYSMSERSLKYAALFVGLTFLVVWLFEVRGGLRPHLLQYLLVGAGMCVFYLLELSLAEHLGFAAAYLLASTAVTVQIGFYSRAVLKSWRRSGAVALLISGLYGLLYVLLREEDFSLLVGSTGLFVALSAVMFLTRRIQWNANSKSVPEEGVPQADPGWKAM